MAHQADGHQSELGVGASRADCPSRMRRVTTKPGKTRSLQIKTALSEPE